MYKLFVIRKSLYLQTPITIILNYFYINIFITTIIILHIPTLPKN